MTAFRILRLPHSAGLDGPRYETQGAAGMDLLAAIDENREIVLHPGERILVPTGFCLQLPEGFEAQVRPRSGLALRHGITVLNAPGTIDSDYRGEVQVILINLGREAFAIARGMRMAQLVVAPVMQVNWIEAEALEASSRGSGGFGSTGLSSRAPETSAFESLEKRR